MPISLATAEPALPSHPYTLPGGTVSAEELARLAIRLAARAVISDIESEAVKVQLDGRVWWDTRPMTDAREHSPQSIDMATAAIQYAIGSGLAAIHPQRPYLLHINNR